MFKSLKTMGALTIKSYEFEMRNWEVPRFVFPNIFTGTPSFLLFFLKNNKVMRVLPFNRNDSISNQVRFSLIDLQSKLYSNSTALITHFLFTLFYNINFDFVYTNSFFSYVYPSYKSSFRLNTNVFVSLYNSNIFWIENFSRCFMSDLFLKNVSSLDEIFVFSTTTLRNFDFFYIIKRIYQTIILNTINLKFIFYRRPIIVSDWYQHQSIDYVLRLFFPFSTFSGNVYIPFMFFFDSAPILINSLGSPCMKR